MAAATGSSRNGKDESLLMAAAKTFLKGSISGVATSTLLQPFDVVRTNQILWKQSSSARQGPGPVGSGPLQVARHIVATDGVAGLWRGLTPTLIRVFLGAGLYFSAIRVMMGVTGTKAEGTKVKPSSIRLFLVGASARCIAAGLMNPISVVKTKMEQGGTQRLGTLETARAIVREDGLRSLLLRGLGPTMLRDAPSHGLYYLLYNRLKEAADDLGAAAYLPAAAVNFACGTTAGVFSTLATHPFDVLRTHMQAHGKAPAGGSGGEGASGSAMLRLAARVYAEDGVAGLFRGATARVTKRALSTALVWTLFEHAGGSTSGKKSEDR